MPVKSDIVSFNNVPVPSGVTGILSAESAKPTTDPVYQDRQEAGSAYQSATRPPVDYLAVFKTPAYADQTAVLAMLDFPRNRTERTLAVYGGDAAAPVQVKADATVVDVEINAGEVRATMRIGDAVWKAAAPIIQGPTNYSADGSMSFTVGGEVAANPLVQIGWSVQRPSQNNVVGWSKRKQITVTNNSTQSLKNYPIQLGPWDTAAIVNAGNMISNGDDVAVFNDKGERCKEEVIAPNSPYSFVNFVIDYLDAGGSRTYDVCYRNPQATLSLGFPYNKAYTPAIDIDGAKGTAAAATATTLTRAVTMIDNEFLGATLIITGGTGIGQHRRVQSHTGLVLTVSEAFTTTPDATSTYVLVRSGYLGDGGNVNSGSATTLVDSTQAWGTNQWIGATAEVYTTSTGVTVKSGTVTGNTADTLTVAAWTGGDPIAGNAYRVYRRNGLWIWFVSQTARNTDSRGGRFGANRVTSQPSSVWFPVNDTPGAWSITEYNPGNAANDFNQPRTYSEVISANEYFFTLLNAKMAKKDSVKLAEEGFGNGVEIGNPLGFLGVRHDFQLKNPDGTCKAFFGSREQGGQDWESYKIDSATLASLTLRPVTYYNLTTKGTPVHLLAALNSVDDADIPDDKNETAILRDGTMLEAYIDTRLLSMTDIQTAAEDDVYDLSLTVRRGAAAEAADDDLIVIGGDERHVFLTKAQKLWIGDDGQVPLGARIYGATAATITRTDNFTDSDGTALQAHPDTSGGSWTKHSSSGAGNVTIDANRAHNANAASTNLYYDSFAPAAGDRWTAADYDVACDVVMRSDNNLSIAGPALRIDPAAETAYYAVYTTVTNVWRLFRANAGVHTQIGAGVAQTLTVDQAYVCWLSAFGSALRVYVDNDLIIAENDSSITAAGKAGVRFDGAATNITGVHLDNWKVRQGGHVYVRDVANGVRVLTVDGDDKGIATRYASADLVPLSPGAVTVRHKDDDGAIGTLDIAYLVTNSFL